eukprot:TRINITY_DN1905_c0_g1_i2.p1 TRINITY_DN1905_c0_g1~~TRINITY_DN1905_c0_g1_i2.p1  ORF type:complete len:182 (-),score=53.06 TRINITY_DN1905_c0_g1_i2:14-559(-)
MVVFGKKTLLSSSTRSILGMIQSLHEDGDYFVAFLIVFFSIIVPIIKNILVAILVADRAQFRGRQIDSSASVNSSGRFKRDNEVRVGVDVSEADLDKQHKLYFWIDTISKWAMSDVFATGVLIAFLGANATTSSNLAAHLEPGFYFFAFYCITSLGSLHFLTPLVVENRNPYMGVSSEDTA